MKIVIDIPEYLYDQLHDIVSDDYTLNAYELAIFNGTPLLSGHGRLIDADECIRQAWNDFYKHEDEWEKKCPDYIGVKRFFDQNGFECCLKTICESPTVIESEEE